MKDNIIQCLLWIYFKGRTKLLHFIGTIPLNSVQCMKDVKKIHLHKVRIVVCTEGCSNFPPIKKSQIFKFVPPCVLQVTNCSCVCQGLEDLHSKRDQEGCPSYALEA